MASGQNRLDESQLCRRAKPEQHGTALVDESSSRRFCSFSSHQLHTTEDFYIRVMTNIEAKLNCEWHIADLKLRIAQLKAGSRLASDGLASAEFIDLLQHNLDSWEERKETLVEHH